MTHTSPNSQSIHNLYRNDLATRRRRYTILVDLHKHLCKIAG